MLCYELNLEKNNCTWQGELIIKTKLGNSPSSEKYGPINRI